MRQFIGAVIIECNTYASPCLLSNKLPIINFAGLDGIDIKFVQEKDTFKMKIINFKTLDRYGPRLKPKQTIAISLTSFVTIYSTLKDAQIFGWSSVRYIFAFNWCEFF